MTPEASRIFVCSDWHFGHKKLPGRPADFEEMISRGLLRSGIRQHDVLLNLGDVYLYDGEGSAREMLAWCKSQDVSTVLVLGNHDSNRFSRLMRMGWSWVCDRTSLKYHGKNFLFTHEPEEAAFEEDLNVHGHLHQVDGHRGGLIRDGKHALISMEMLAYRPVPLDVVARLGQTPIYSLGKFVGEAQVGERYSDSIGDAEEPEETCAAEGSANDGGDMRT